MKKTVINIIKNRQARVIVSATVVIVTVVIFVRFFINHPSYRSVLSHVSPWAVLTIIGLNALLTIALAYTYKYGLELCQRKLKRSELLLLTSYTSVVNFIGPLQSGPGFRAVYLKTKHKVAVKDYLLITLVTYAVFASISALFLIGGSRPWWQGLLGLVLVAGLSTYIIKWIAKRKKDKANQVSNFRFDQIIFGKLVLATLIEIIIVATYYLVELKAVDKHVNLHQVISYTGAANFSLFVSITPDAIGIREAFLVFARHFHHISNSDIITANVIDRAAFAIFLVLLAIVVFGFHVNRKLQAKQPIT